MSPTVLEIVVLIILIIVAWQLGLLLAPYILREFRSMRDSLDDIDDDVYADERMPQQDLEQQQEQGKDRERG